MRNSTSPVEEGFLFTDQYQLTMAQLYYRCGLHEKRCQFDHFFRNYPNYGSHKAGYCISAGLEWFVTWMQNKHCRNEDIEYLRTQTNRVGKRIFADDFLEWLRKNGDYSGMSIQAIPEGRVVHPNVPMTVVQGPLAMAQIMETALLNMINYQTLIATKAARIKDSGRGQQLLEFGLRRAHDKGGNAGTRAALIGGADFSSNVGMSHHMGLFPKGTHAHSMVQLFMALNLGELEAFRAYAEIYPDDCLFLVDTINTLESGVPNAIKVFEELRLKGNIPVGIRLDSGDLAYLSIQSAKMLDEAGFPDTKIVLSNDLDELVIMQIITQIQEEAPRYGIDSDRLIKRLVYGVGTRLIVSEGDSALGGVYKMVAVHDEDHWIPAIKISETPSKTPNPGNKRAWRLYDQRGKATADLLTLEDEDPQKMDPIILLHPDEPTMRRSLAKEEMTKAELLLKEYLNEGKLVEEFPSLEEIRKIRENDIGLMDPGVRRLMNPHIYHVSLSQKLWEVKQELIKSALSHSD